MTLETERLILRPWKEQDASALYRYACDPDVGPSAGWNPHASEEDSMYTIRNILNGPECYAVCLKETNEPIGSIELIPKSRISALNDDEFELGYWLAKPFWGMGLIPEAGQELLRRAFLELDSKGVRCCYFFGNDKSKRVQEKLGFKYKSTIENVVIPATGATVTIIENYLTRESWQQSLLSSLDIVKLSDCPQLTDKASQWFSSKWGIPAEAYAESIADSAHGNVPCWYLCMKGKEIVAGLGVIDNDFHNRKDLTPNVCAVYTEPRFRCLGIAGQMLNRVCTDMADKGIDKLYLVTDHTSFYERYGWEYLCQVQCEGEDAQSRMYIHKAD